jgi:ribosomal protein S18 acetylase RimI-like enzyme
MMGETPDAEIHVRSGCVMALSGEDAADLNMIVLEGPEEIARDFLTTSMRTVAQRRLPVLVQTAPALAEALAAEAQDHGLTPAGTLPLMVQRAPAEPRPSRACEIVEVSDAEATAEAMTLVSSAFRLPHDKVAKAFGPSALAGSGCQFYLARSGGVSMSSVTVTREQRVAGVWCMATPPDRQGQGWGRALLSGVIDQLRRDGVERIYLFATAEGFTLYRSLGFETIAEEPVWVKGHSTQVHG